MTINQLHLIEQTQQIISLRKIVKHWGKSQVIYFFILGKGDGSAGRHHYRT